MPWGYAAAGAGALLGGYLSSSGSKDAASTQANADLQAQKMQQGMFDKIVKQEQPFLKEGYSATSQLKDMLSPGGYLTRQFKPTMTQLENYPGYQFQLKQGDRALQSSDAATVGALSGPAMKDLMSFNQNLAQTTYGNMFNQYQTQQNNIFNRLSSIASLGQNAAANLGNSGTTLGTGMAQAQSAAGGALAAGQIGSANAYAGAASNIPLYALMANSGGGMQAQQGDNNSDRRLKTDIKRIGKTDGGLPLYSYRYKGDDPKHYIGPMADEVREVQPEAVFRHEDGYDRVYYRMLR